MLYVYVKFKWPTPSRPQYPPEKSYVPDTLDDDNAHGIFPATLIGTSGKLCISNYILTWLFAPVKACNEVIKKLKATTLPIFIYDHEKPLLG